MQAGVDDRLAAGSDAASGFRIYHDLRGHHRSTADGTLYLLEGGESVGYLDYAEFDGQPRIVMVNVHPRHRRRGCATRLLVHLQSLFPGREIDWGHCTLEGRKLKAAVPTRQDGSRCLIDIPHAALASI